MSLLSVCVIAAAMLSACKRSDGESCQQNADCDDGLVCCIAESAARGTCASSLDACSQSSSSSGDDDGGAG